MADTYLTAAKKFVATSGSDNKWLVQLRSDIRNLSVAESRRLSSHDAEPSLEAEAKLNEQFEQYLNYIMQVIIEIDDSLSVEAAAPARAVWLQRTRLSLLEEHTPFQMAEMVEKEVIQRFDAFIAANKGLVNKEK